MRMAIARHHPTLQEGAARRVLASAENILAWGVERAAAALIAAEIAILLAGVISRYFLDAPLVWTDELASILFLWLAMLGSVVMNVGPAPARPGSHRPTPRTTAAPTPA